VTPVLIEVAVTTADEARRAAAAGADRLELCSALEVGGITPSAATFLHVRDAVSIPVWVLVRPRPGGFEYSPGEFATLKQDAAWFLNHGAAGIVVGVVNADRTIDRERSAELVALANGKAAFHRAFDFTPDRFTALETLIELGFCRVLTSGGAATALAGAEELAKLIRAARGRIEVLPGGGIIPANVLELVRRTGCTQIHGSFRTASTGMGSMGDTRTTAADAIRAAKAAAI
jgi:copper homeostasis protein